MTITEFMNDEGLRYLEVQRNEMRLELRGLFGPENKERARELCKRIVVLGEMIAVLRGQA